MASTADYMVPLAKAAGEAAGKRVSTWQTLYKMFRSNVVLTSGAKISFNAVTVNGAPVTGFKKFYYLARYTPSMLGDLARAIPAAVPGAVAMVKPTLTMLNSKGLMRPVVGGITGTLVNIGGRMVFVSSGVAVAVYVVTEAISRTIMPQSANAGEFANSLLGSAKGFEFVMSMDRDRLLQNASTEPELANALINLASAVTSDTAVEPLTADTLTEP